MRRVIGRQYGWTPSRKRGAKSEWIHTLCRLQQLSPTRAANFIDTFMDKSHSSYGITILVPLCCDTAVSLFYTIAYTVPF